MIQDQEHSFKGPRHSSKSCPAAGLLDPAGLWPVYRVRTLVLRLNQEAWRKEGTLGSGPLSMVALWSRGRWRENGAMVPEWMDVRRFPRVNVEEGYSIQFQAGKRRFFGLPLTSLGGGGCCFQVSSLLAEGLHRDAILTRVRIEHPELSGILQQARISWILGNPLDQGERTVQVGIEYLHPELTFLQAIDRCIARMGEKR